MIELSMMLLDDNFLDPSDILSLQKMMYKDPNSNFPWYFHGGTNETTNQDAVLTNNKYIDSQQFVHLAYHNSQKYSPFHDTCLYIFDKFVKKHNIKVENIFRVKANLILKDGDQTKIHYPHIDTDHEHLVFLYYVNDSDGNTIFFNKKYPEDNSNLIEQKHISPKAGRGVLFDGLQYHSSSSPIKNNIRCVINIDFIGSL